MEYNKYDNLDIWMNNLYEDIKTGKIRVTDWKATFKKFKLILLDSEYSTQLNCLMYLKNLTTKFNHTDFEIRSSFISIFDDILKYLSSDNVI
jgi:hypothetical protein